MNYWQTLLVKQSSPNLIYTVAWIPEKFAHVGKSLKLRDDSGNWNDGWLVKELYNYRSANFVLSHERDWTKQREASDI
jgi:hypothetical protein